MAAAEIRLVLDSNILVSRLLVPRGTAGQAVDRALSQGILLACEETMGELATVLARSKFDRYVSRDDRRRFLELLGGVVRMIPIRHRIQACRDPKDDMLLNLALNGDAACLVTGDQDLLVLGPGFQSSHGLLILSPATYLGWVPQGWAG